MYRQNAIVLMTAVTSPAMYIGRGPTTRQVTRLRLAVLEGDKSEN
jgi:hypothetical protein